MKKTISVLVLCMVAVACAPQTRFAWGGYEASLYKYYKNSENREVYRASLQKAVARGLEEDRVAPGLLAELGYLSLEDGSADEAVGYFEQEMMLFPESRPFMKRIIDKVNKPQGVEDDSGLVS